MFLNVYSENRCLLWWLRGLPQMQGIQVDPGTSQFRRLWATSTEKMMSTNMTRPDLSHSCRLERSRPNPAPKGAPHGIREIGPIFLAQGPDHEMSAMGHKRKWWRSLDSSALRQEADITERRAASSLPGLFGTVSERPIGSGGLHFPLRHI